MKQLGGGKITIQIRIDTFDPYTEFIATECKLTLITH